jgi:NAD(P)-dependent dehydrogenase (short-subunit alcohol dehydrogenase family)
MPGEEGSNILVTGADRGIGLGFAHHFLQRGDKVFATSRRPRAGSDLSALREQYAEQLDVINLDVSDELSLARFAEAIRARNIMLDVVINNAGMCEEQAYGDWSASSFGAHFLVNTVGPALVAQAIEPVLGNGAKVIQISSGMGSTERNINPQNGLDAYAISKCGLNILSRRLAEKLRPKGVVVLSLDPGWVRTEMGGTEAPTEVDDAVRQMTLTIQRAGMGDTGAFLSSNGTRIPW